MRSPGTAHERSCHHARVTEGADGVGGPALRVVLLKLPLALYVAAEAQWKGLLREYVLRGLGDFTQTYGPEEVARAGHALDTLTNAVEGLDPSSLLLLAGQQGDVELHSSSVTAEDFGLLQGVLDDAIRLSHAGELLILAPLPEVVALRNWFCNQAMQQSAGGLASPWQLRGDGPEPPRTRVTWDTSIEPSPEAAWLVGDDHNRIVAASPAALALLGWTGDQLVGQRLLAVIPPAYREAHLAAFTRSVVEGVGRILGTPLRLPALRADGSEVPIILTLTRHAAHAGRTVFLAMMEPR
jgi:PAS domain S-box-containing protein